MIYVAFNYFWFSTKFYVNCENFDIIIKILRKLVFAQKIKHYISYMQIAKFTTDDVIHL